MEVSTSLTDGNTSRKEGRAENPNLCQQQNTNPEVEWVPTLGGISCPQENICSFLHDNRAEGTTVEQKQDLKEKENSGY